MMIILKVILVIFEKMNMKRSQDAYIGYYLTLIYYFLMDEYCCYAYTIAFNIKWQNQFIRVRMIMQAIKTLGKGENITGPQSELDIQSLKNHQILFEDQQSLLLNMPPLERVNPPLIDQKLVSNISSDPMVEQGEKKIGFIDSIDDSKRQEEESLIPSNAPTKWNIYLGNEKKGKFSLKQQKIISQAVGQFIVKHQITFEEFLLILNKPNVVNTVLKKLNFFNIISSLLPHRTANSCYRFLRRAFNNQNRKGKWTQEEESRLLELVKRHGKDWRLIGEQLQRTSENVYDKYKSLGSQHSKKRRKSNWQFRQLVQLFKQVSTRTKTKLLSDNIEEDIKKEQQHNINDHISHQKAQYNHKGFQFHNNQVIMNCLQPAIKTLRLEMIHWTNISKTIKTRSMIDCKNKFMQIMEAYFKRNPINQIRVIDFIEDQNVEQQNQIDWQLWEDFHIDYLQIKNRYTFLKKQTQGRSFKSLKDLLKQLRYKLAKPLL